MFVRVTVCHLNDRCRLFPLLHHVQFGSAVSLIISDVNRNRRGLQPLIAATLTAAPVIDVLPETERQEMCNKVRTHNIMLNIKIILVLLVVASAV